MKVYSFLMRLNETRNVLWHESCKCVCKLNSSVCNNKQIWNSDTCRCDCNEDFCCLIGYTEEIEGSSDKYLVVAKSVRNKDIISVLDMMWGSIENKINSNNIEIKDYDKFRFNSDIDLPLDTTIEFRSLVINVSCVIEKDNEYYPEIDLDECFYVKGNVSPTKTSSLKNIKYNIK